MNRTPVALFLRPPTFTKPISPYGAIRQVRVRPTSTVAASLLGGRELRGLYVRPTAEKLVLIRLSSLPGENVEPRREIGFEDFQC